MSNLYEKIDYLCKQKGVSILKMCKDSGINKSSVYDMKYGMRTGISVKTAQKIADYFGITVDELYSGEKNKPPIPDGKSELIDAIIRELTALPEEKQRDVFRYIQFVKNG